MDELAARENQVGSSSIDSPLRAAYISINTGTLKNIFSVLQLRSGESLLRSPQLPLASPAVKLTVNSLAPAEVGLSKAT